LQTDAKGIFRRVRKAGACLMISAILALPFGQAHAASGFDGDWTIVIFGTPGPCFFFYRLPLSIDGESILYKGRTVNPTAMSVTSRGRVAFRLGDPKNTVTGTGALGKAGRGEGKWTAPSFRCTGFWRAFRK
jgi:hypothetical protein